MTRKFSVDSLKRSRPDSPRDKTPDTVNHTAEPEKPVESRHGRNPSDRTIELMSACEALRIAAGQTYTEVGRACDIDRSDVSKALRLIEEPTARTIRRLCSFFDIGSIDDLAREDAEVAILYSISYHGKAIGELAEKLIERRE